MLPGSTGLLFKMTMAVLFVLSLTIRPALSADVEFRWAILADSKEGMQGLDFSGPPIVHSGTALQIYLEHLENCHIYLYLLDSSNNLTPLYPPAKGYYNYGFPRGPKYIPPGQESFTFVPPAGDEFFYLISSADRLFRLEQLTEEFAKNPNSPGQHDLLLKSLEDIISSVEQKSKRAEYKETVTRKIKTSDGITTKKFVALEVAIADLYGRKLLIDHR